MIRKILGIEGINSITHFDLTLRWTGAAVLCLILAAIGYAVFIYWRERRLSVPRKVLLGSLRASVLLIIIFLLLEPVLGFKDTVTRLKPLLVLMDVSESMNTSDKRKSYENQKDAALALGKIRSEQPQGLLSTPLSDKIRSEVSDVSRIELAKNILNLPSFRQLTSDYRVHHFKFGAQLDSIAEKEIANIDAKDKITRLGTAIKEAVSQYAGQPIAGIVLLTDGASNEGLAPLSVARQMQEQNIPLYPVGIGLPKLPDVQLHELLVQDTVFCKDKVPVRVQILSNGYSGKEIKLALFFDENKIENKRVILTGDAQFEEFVFIPEKTGLAKLEVTNSFLPGEISSENNRLSRTIRVIDDKAKVLYIEGKPRWEYRYLRWILLRDHRSDVKFLMAEGDPEFAGTSEQYLTQFPKERTLREIHAELFRYDLLILGDVSSSYFTTTQLELIRDFVREQGGSFLMIAGSQQAPASYTKTPIASILPIEANNEDSLRVGAKIYPTITTAGYNTKVMSLGASRKETQKLWSLVKPLYKVPSLDGTKPGAVVLAELSKNRYPLVAWQRYGKGKSLYIGTDQLWRLRYKNGDKYHARFWGQVNRFLTLSRLLGGNKRIKLMVEQGNARTGEEVKIFANVLNEFYEPVTSSEYTVHIDRLKPEWSTTIQLKPVPNVPGLYQGFFTPTVPGDYRLRTSKDVIAMDSAINPQFAKKQANSVITEFHVKARSLGESEVVMQEKLLKRMAEISGGKYFSIGDLSSLSQNLTKEKQTVRVYNEKVLWNLPIIFVILVVLMGAEWLLRRRYDLV